ncbi:protein of unknown function [Shinella sp. WSC3-e]|nr:hypothetical protein SHINE37_41002 [Rhizobiaceae bacterium]CAK7255660.1 protein of unknown function [Shinella sp. WSC3-e]
MIIANKVGFLQGQSFKELMGRSEDVGKMLRALIRSLQDKL